MKLQLSRLQLLLRMHDLLKCSKSQPIVISSKSYVEFMEKTFGVKAETRRFHS